MDAFAADETFHKINFTSRPLPKGEYDHCQFLHCDLSSANLSEIKFIDCVFRDCNLSLAAVSTTVFRDIRFTDCKILGVRWEEASRFGFTCLWQGCVLDNGSFTGMKLKQTVFERCQMRQVDWSGCDLSQSVFDGCDLADAVFENTVLEKADLRTAFHFSIDPERNRLRKARFSPDGLPGLLGKYGIVIG